jgi:hypothetical protein
MKSSGKLGTTVVAGLYECLSAIVAGAKTDPKPSSAGLFATRLQKDVA